MKVTLINHSDTLGGASIVTYRLMEALRAEGIDARMLVGTKNSASPYVAQASSRIATRIPFYKEHLRIYAANGFSRRRLFQVSIATDGLPLSRHPWVREADAVILNWVNQGLLSLDEIARIAKAKPTLWTMHDQWNLTGICHHTDGCDRYRTHCRDCHFLGRGAGKNDLSARVFDRKEKLYSDVPLTFIAVSDWLASRAARSALLGGRKVVSIPNAFPVEAYAAPPSLSRADLGLPEGKKLILFCAARIDDPGKGLDDAIAILNGLADTHADSACAVFAGACRSEDALSSLLMPYIACGPVRDAERMRSLMHHADIVLSTSPFETLSTTMIEAQAAGSTPVCYTHDGRGDIVCDGESGYSLGRNTEESINVLRNALYNPLDKEALRIAAERYSASSIARKYIELLRETV